MGLWKGLGPNIGRNAIINAAELASYDQVKGALLATGVFQDNIVTHILSGGWVWGRAGGMVGRWMVRGAAGCR
jgi:hypothetical protein